MKRPPMYKVTVLLPGLVTSFHFPSADHKTKFLRVCARENIEVHAIERIFITDIAVAEQDVIKLRNKQRKRNPRWQTKPNSQDL